MKMKKQDLSLLIKEEVGDYFAAQRNLSKKDIENIIDRLLKKLDSIDMSLDMIYGSLVGASAPIASTRAVQRAKGRVATARPATIGGGGE